MEHKEHKIMKTKTIKLKNYLKQINSNYENVRSTGEQKDFYTVIQPFVDEVYEFYRRMGRICKKLDSQIQTEKLSCTTS